MLEALRTLSYILISRHPLKLSRRIDAAALRQKLVDSDRPVFKYNFLDFTGLEIPPPGGGMGI